MRRSAVFLHIGIAVIGFVLSTQIRAAGTTPCKPKLASCPEIGCAKAGSADAVINKLKRRVPTAGTPQQLTLDDFEKLQERADTLVGQRKSLTAQQRKKLKALSVSSGKVAEGDLVEITGYVIAEHSLPHPNTGESVNCRLKGSDNNDFHVPIARQPSDSIFDGIVVEMIPQDRPSGWTIKKLKKVAKEEREVLVRGQLLYDNKHVINDNPAEPEPGQPARFSLWEVHPVTEFLVCKNQSGECDQNNSGEWERLEDYEN